MTAGPPASLRRSPAVYFTSDYGTADEFVGVVHAVLHRFAPGVPVVDLSHEVPAFDVAAGADLLVRCTPVLGPGVVLAVVDPEVGTDRRAVAVGVEPARGDPRERPGWLVGPDNGLLVPLAGALGGARRAFAVDRAAASARGWPAVAGSWTFDGRDLLGPAAAHLVMGGSPELLGPELDPGTLTPPPHRLSPRSGEGEEGEVLLALVRGTDRFGNVQLDLGVDDLERAASRSAPELEVAFEIELVPDDRGGLDRVQAGATTRRARQVRAYALLDPGELGVLVDAVGRAALVCDRASAADLLGRPQAGDRVRLRLVAG